MFADAVCFGRFAVEVLEVRTVVSDIEIEFAMDVVVEGSIVRCWSQIACLSA
jgi:hypothetical protein